MEDLEQQELKTIGHFEIKRKLGAGAFGVVYEAYDRERNSVVALKLLHQINADALYYFKQEFRALADVVHPNLVTLYELVSDGEQWFLTMELVRGINFLEYVRDDSIAQKAASLADSPTMQVNTSLQSNAATFVNSELHSDPMAETQTSLSEVTIDDKIFIVPTPQFATTYQLDAVRLCSTLKQLADGIYALHQAGKLHRDLKPSNVLVTEQGRVVILDFGLVTEVDASGLHESLDFVGTPNYMSPEQGAGFPVSDASDWYSFGVILYEALTGRLPFTGQLQEVLKNKQRLQPISPAQLVEGIPIDLVDLCMDLLSQQSSQRPTGSEILRRMREITEQVCEVGEASSRDITAKAAGEPHQIDTRQSLARAMPFVGRESHLAYLTASYLLTKQHRAVTVYVHGRSGMGKSAVIRRFLEDLQQRESLVVLTGRCYEKESVPYKAFDSLIDTLTQYLKSLPNVEIELLLPRDVLALARLFPVLRQIEAVINRQRNNIEIPDLQELRRRAFTALRELLIALAKHQSLILFIDDLHWGDIDSVALLAELLRPPEPPTMLLIASYRSEETATSPFLQALLPLRVDARDYEVRDLEVGELAPTESRLLAASLLGEQQAKYAETIIREAGGSPYFIDELVRYSQSDGFAASRKDQLPGEPAAERTRLDQLIQARVLQLPATARLLLEIVAIAGQPLDITIARELVDLTNEESAILAMLRAGRWIRIRSVVRNDQHHDEIESYHDRIRETVVAHLSEAQSKSHHLNLARALEAVAQTDPEALVVHFQAAGEYEKTAKYAVIAADQASEALAFDRAARLYRLALDLHCQSAGLDWQTSKLDSSSRLMQSDQDTLDRSIEQSINTINTIEQALRIKLGEALTKAGRGAEAAEVYLDAARDARATTAIELQRRAAEQFLCSGHIDNGLTALRVVLELLGIRLPKTPWGSVLSLLLWRFVLRLRGIGFHERSAAGISNDQLIRIDTYSAVALGLGQVDPVRGANFQTRHLLLALQAGEPKRIARALGAEICYYAAVGGRSHRRVDFLSQLTMALSQRINDQPAIAMTTLAIGFAAFSRGDWQQGYELNARAEAILREHCTGMTLELDTAQYYSLCSLQHMGRLKSVFERLPMLLKEARERGDLYAETLLSTRYSYAGYLCADDVEGAQTDLIQSMNRWSRAGFHHQHYLEMSSQTQIYLYAEQGNGEQAWQYINSRWPLLKSSLFILVQVVRIEALHTRARSALAAAAVSQNADKMLRAAAKDARKIAREKCRWGAPFAELIDAGIAAHHGNYQLAITKLISAEEQLRACDMALYAAAARHRRGELINKINGTINGAINGTAGQDLIESANQSMAGEQIKNPDRMTTMLLPGRWSRELSAKPNH